jgi:hypothetical protein
MMEMKKIYLTPEVVVMLLDTEELMRASQPSETPTPPGAPFRRDVF